ncbi:hypothetical protein GCM10010129_02230 [Streptomyces fumigatiscleroticus]|nr:hypothetical protein GCM10010129_02230 [Streptomyces fumigatiscleroticus]
MRTASADDPAPSLCDDAGERPPVSARKPVTAVSVSSPGSTSRTKGPGPRRVRFVLRSAGGPVGIMVLTSGG